MRDYIPLGSDNLFPQALARFARSSPNHRGILDSKHTYIVGDGITSEDTATQTLIEAVNYEDQSLTEVASPIIFDDILSGNAWIELITDRNGSFLWFNHLDTTKCRLSKDRDFVIMHPDWARDKGKTDKNRIMLPVYPNFQQVPGDKYSAFRCVYHLKRYEPEFVYYGLPKYISSKDSIQIDFKTNKWNLARLKNSFRVSGILVVPVKDKEESKDVIDYINREYIGEDNQAKLLTITKSRARDNEKADQTQLVETKQDDEGSWMDLHRQSIGDMVVSHGWFRSLTGLADNTGFDTQRILNEYEVALNTVIKPMQGEYVKLFQKLYREVTGQELELNFVNQPPFDTDDYKYIWELRKEKGLDFNENDPMQKLLVLNNTTINGTNNTNGGNISSV